MTRHSAKPDYAISPIRAVLAFLVLSFALSSPIQFFYLCDLLRRISFGAGGSFPSDKFSLWAFPAFWAAAAVFALLFFVSVWAVLHASGRKSWIHAAAAGFFISFAGVVVSFVGDLGHGVWPGWLPFFIAPTLAGLVGCVSMLLAWRIAYRRIPNPSA